MDHVHAAWEVPSSLLPSIIHMVTQCSVLSMLLLLNYACRKKTLCCLRLCYSPSKKVASAACQALLYIPNVQLFLTQVLLLSAVFI